MLTAIYADSDVYLQKIAQSPNRRVELDGRALRAAIVSLAPTPHLNEGGGQWLVPKAIKSETYRSLCSSQVAGSPKTTSDVANPLD